MANNPFQLVYDSLWTMMEADARFDVKEGNKIKFNNNKREPVKSQHTTSDYPEVMLLPESGIGNISSTSSTSSVSKRYTWVVSSGDFRYTEISDLEWALTAGLLGWMYSLKSLTWNENEFVKLVNVISTDLEVLDRSVARARSQGINGLVSVFTVEVSMVFSNETIRSPHLVLGQA